MAEAIRRIAPEILGGITPLAPAFPIFEIPSHLRRAALKKIRNNGNEPQEKLWEERGNVVEARVKSIIETQAEIVESVTMNEPYTKGSDLTIEFVDGFPVKKVFVEVKSSTHGIRDFKHKIRDNLPNEETNGQLIDPWTKEKAVSEWLTEHGIILINGSEYKSPKEILTDSFYPQLERIKQKALIDRNIPIQVFPETQTA